MDSVKMVTPEAVGSGSTLLKKDKSWLSRARIRFRKVVY